MEWFGITNGEIRNFDFAVISKQSLRSPCPIIPKLFNSTPSRSYTPMNKGISFHLWLTQDFKQFFLIPNHTILMSGLDPIYDLQENQKLVSLEAISSYECSQEDAQAHLQALWKTSLESTKQAWIDLYTFSQKTGKEINIAELSEQFKQGLQISSPQTQEIFNTSQALVESITAAANNQENISEAEQKALFKRVFSQLPQLLDQFSKANLEAAARDPDVWADNLYQQVFGELDKKKHEQRNQRIADEVRESIAEGLRAVGITPSIDFDKDE